ncbi:helix-turn-helix domain-containing protein [Haladaptatus sp. NG-SE-30]
MVTIITDIRVPAGSFPLGRILRQYPEVEIELERIVPMENRILPLFWVGSESEEAVEETLRDDPLVEKVTKLTRTPDRILYSVNWNPEVNGLVQTIIDLGIKVLSAEGTSNFWEFRLQFDNREQLNRFRRNCQDEDISVDLLRLYNPVMPAESGPLSTEQTDALTAAFENGYWDVPREITQGELADLIGISDNALSERLRRGTRIIMEEMLYGRGIRQRER